MKSTPVLAAALIVVLAASTGTATQPALSSITPYGIQRGTIAEVAFNGARLGDIQELMLYSPGITVESLTAETDGKVVARLNVAADCPVGLHAVRLRTATGISDLRTFSIGLFPEESEKEPNNDFKAPQPVEFGRVVNGVVQNEDVDYFVVEAKKGDRISVELEGLRLGNTTFFDPSLAILNTDRFELVRSDDAALLRQDSVVSLIAPEDGQYIIEVRECAYGGDGNCKYRMHVGHFPRPLVAYPAGGRPGQTLDVQWIGDAAGNWTQSIALPEAATSEFEVLASDAQGLAPSPNRLRVVDLENVLEVEPNNGIAEATPGLAPAALNGIIQEPGDIDCFRFTAKKGQVYDIRVHARSVIRSPLDAVLVVQRSGGAGVGSNDDTGGPDSYLRFTAPEDDDYIVTVYDQLRAGGPEFVYRVEITPIVPELVMSLPERSQYVPTTLSVPQGNRMALMINASRANFGGDLKVAVEGLPAGLTHEPVTMPASQSSVPVLFSAAADAAPGGALADLTGRPVDENLALVGHLSQRTMLVRGQNNRDVWGHDASRMATALTAAVPFQLEIVEPQVPIVRNGSMSLKVVARRAEGFNEPIAIRLLYNPPGIGSSGSIAIAGDKTEAEIPLTANGGAGIGKWPLLVTGSAKVGDASAEISSQLAQLEVADGYFNFTFEKAAAEQGKETGVVVKVAATREFEGSAEIELLGLPAKTATNNPKLEVTKDGAELIYPVQVEADARPGIYKSLICRAVLVQNGEPITQTVGTGELRIDQPIAPKVEAKPAEVKPAEPVVAKAPAPKPLSRLEQLRLEREKNREGGESKPPEQQQQ